MSQWLANPAVCRNGRGRTPVFRDGKTRSGGFRFASPQEIRVIKVVLDMVFNKGGAFRRTGGLVLGAAIVTGSVLAGSAYAAGPAGPEASIDGWSKDVTLKPGGEPRTFTVTVHNYTDHTVNNVDVGYSTYSDGQPVLEKEVQGKWETLSWGHTPQSKGTDHSFAALEENKTLKSGESATYKVKASLPPDWDKKVTDVKATAGAEGDGWNYFLPVDFKVAP
jgi:hypothetical protein